jgi:hypothetical protein
MRLKTALAYPPEVARAMKCLSSQDRMPRRRLPRLQTYRNTKTGFPRTWCKRAHRECRRTSRTLARKVGRTSWMEMWSQAQQLRNEVDDIRAHADCSSWAHKIRAMLKVVLPRCAVREERAFGVLGNFTDELAKCGRCSAPSDVSSSWKSAPW